MGYVLEGCELQSEARTMMIVHRTGLFLFCYIFSFYTLNDITTPLRIIYSTMCYSRPSVYCHYAVTDNT
jgi:hypothetical protein